MTVHSSANPHGRGQRGVRTYVRDPDAFSSGPRTPGGPRWSWPKSRKIREIWSR